MTFPDGTTRTFTRGVTGFEIARSISESLAKAALAVTLDGMPADLSLPIERDCALKIIGAKTPRRWS